MLHSNIIDMHPRNQATAETRKAFLTAWKDHGRLAKVLLNKSMVNSIVYKDAWTKLGMNKSDVMEMIDTIDLTNRR